MAKKSAGILAYRIKNHLFQILLVHPGGPFWKNKNEYAWSIPKGELNDNEDALVAAKREFKEELGFEVTGDFIVLDPIKQKGGKQVIAFAVEFDADVSTITSNTIEVEWPPRSGKQITIPEVDKAEWFDLIDALDRMNESQFELVNDLLRKKYNLNNEQLKKINRIAQAIKQNKLINFFYISHKDDKKWEFKGYRKVEPYFIGRYIDKETLSLTGYFYPTEEQQSAGKEERQGNYLIDDIDLEKFSELNETYDTIKVKSSHINNTITMIILYKTKVKRYDVKK